MLINYRQLKHPNIIELYDVVSTTIKSINLPNEWIASISPIQSDSIKRMSQKPINRHLGDLYLIFEYMDTDLSNIIKSNQFIQLEHVQFILYQILIGMKYIHSANVIHRGMYVSV